MRLVELELIGNDREVELMLGRLETALMPSALAIFLGAKVGTYLKMRATQRFEMQGDDVSGKWAPLLPSTQQVRASGQWPVESSSPINKRTGELENYITGSDIFAATYGAGAMVRYPGNSPATPSLKEKVLTAQSGKDFPRTVPRPVLGMNGRDEIFILTELAFYVTGDKR